MGARPLAGKRALVTGAARGIGRGIAERLARDGAVVAVHYGTDRSGAETVVRTIQAAGGNAFPVTADVRDVGAIGELYATLDAEFGRRCGEPGLDILVNNAAYRTSGSVMEVTEAEFDRMYAVNVKGLFFVTMRAVERLQEGGRIIHISSTAAQHARRRLVAYAATKGAVESFTRSLAADLAPRGITVNAVAPGTTETDEIREQIAADPERERVWRGQIAFGRIGKPEEVAAVVAFLASPDGGWVTGHVVPASGGTNL